MKKQAMSTTPRSSVTEVTVIDSQFDHFRDYIDVIQVYQCRICGYHSPLRHAIASHMSEVHFPKTCYLCQLCQFVYEDKAQLRHHITSTHANECTDEPVRYDATVNAPGVALPTGFIPNGVPYAQFRHTAEPATAAVSHSDPPHIRDRSMSRHPYEGCMPHNFGNGDPNYDNCMRVNNMHSVPVYNIEGGSINQAAEKRTDQNCIGVKREPVQDKQSRKVDDGQKDPVRVISCDSYSNSNESQNTKENKSPQPDRNVNSNTVSHESKKSSDTQVCVSEQKDRQDKQPIISYPERERLDKRRGKTKSRSKPTLSAVLTNLASQHLQAETTDEGRKRESPERESSGSEADTDSATRSENKNTSITRSTDEHRPESGRANPFLPGHCLTYKRAQGVGLPPKKIKLEIIENPAMPDVPTPPSGGRYDGPYNTDGSFDYYSITGWKAYRCEICNKGKRGRKVSFKSAQELAEHNYFVHGIPMPVHSNAVPVGIMAEPTNGGRLDAAVPFEMYRPPIPWPPPHSLPTAGSHRPIPVLDLSLQMSSTDAGSGSDVNADETSMPGDRNGHQSTNDEEEDSRSDDSRSTGTMNEAMRYMSYNGDTSDNGSIHLDFHGGYAREAEESGYMGHKVRKTFSSRLAALERGEISRKKDPKFDESIIKTSYNADGSFDYFSLTGWKAYKCDLCKKRRFKTATELAEHKQAMHPNMGTKDDSHDAGSPDRASPDAAEKMQSECEGAG